MKKSILVLSMLFAGFAGQASAQVAKDAEITALNKELSAVGKELVNDCSKNNSKAICLDNIKSKLATDTAIRIILPNSAVTMDYSENRVNINISKENKILTITRG